MPFKDEEAERKYRKEYREDHREDRREKSKETYLKNKNKIKKRTHEWRRSHKDIVNYQGKLYVRKIKNEIIYHYSHGTMQCAMCGYDIVEALSVDHIDGGGSAHRREIGSGGGYHFYQWLRRNDFPFGYRILCMNCQFLVSQAE